MKVFKILLHAGQVRKALQEARIEAGGEFGLCVGVVVNNDGTLTPDQALTDWNTANPSYQGDTAAEGPFLLK